MSYVNPLPIVTVTGELERLLICSILEIVDLMGQFFCGNDSPCQTHCGDEFPERPGCANKGVGLDTDRNLCLNGVLSLRIIKRTTFLACSSSQHGFQLQRPV